MQDGWHANEMDRVWDRLRERALLHAEVGVLLSMADARRIVGHLFDGECKQPPSEQVKEQLASELVRLTIEANHTRRSRPPRRLIRGVC